MSDDLENTIKGIDTTQLKTYSTKEIDNKIAEVNQKIKDSGIKYFSINSASQSTNSNNTGANGDGDADAMAIGPNAKASSVKALAIGNNVLASGTLSIAIGTASDPSTDTTTAEMPHPTSSEGTSSVAIGTSAIAQTNDSIAIGTRAATYTANTTSTPVSTVGVQSIAIGFSAETRDDNAISIGTKSKANSADAVAIGDGAEALNTSAVVIGKSSIANGSDSVTIGESNTNDGQAVLATGNSNSITNTVNNSGVYGSSNKIQSVSSSNSSNAITDVYAVGNSNTLNQNGEKNILTDVSIMGNKNTIENGTAGAYTQTVKQIAVVGSGNAVKGNTQVDATTWGTVQRDTILGYNNTVDATKQSTPVSNLQILGNDVQATLGNSVYLGTKSSVTASKSATAEAIQLAKEQGDTEALASDEYKNATTEEAKNAIKQKYEAKYIHAANVAAMDKDGISAGVTNYDTDYTYGNDSSYTYAGSQADGIVTVGSKDATRRIQNVSAGLVGPNSTDAVNGSQLYALTRQIRFGGDNSTFGKTTAADDVNVVAKGSNEKLAITGGAEGVSNTTTTDGKSVTTIDGTKIADKNIAVIAEDDALHVKLASNLKDLNTAQLGKTTATTTKADDGTETTTYSYQETLKFDGTGDNGGTLALKDAKGENGVTLRTSGATKTADVTGAETNRLLVNDKTVATTDDGLKFGGDTGTDSALKLNSKLTVKGGATTGLSDNNNIGVVSDGKGTLTVKLNKDVNLGTDGSLTAGAVTAATVTTGDSTLTTSGLSIANGPSVLTSGINAGNKKITSVKAGETDTDAANYGQVKAAKTTLTQGSNVTITPDTTSDDKHTNYTVSVSNLSYKAGTDTTAKNVTLSNGLTFNDGTNTTASVGEDGAVAYSLKPEISLTKVTTGNTTMDTNGLVISGGPTIAAGGINAGGKTITGVANGVGDNDAVNISQLKAVQSDINAGWTIKGKDSVNADVSANIGKGKSVTYNNGSYTKAVVTQDDSGNAAVTVDVTTGTLTTGTDGKITSSDGLATTGDVANAVNSTSWTIQDGNHTKNAQQVKAGDTVSFKAGDNLSLEQNGKEFTYKLNKTLTDMDSVTTVDDKQNTSVLNGEGLKVSDKDGNSLTQHATEIRIHDSNAKADDTTTDVVLKKDGLHNGGHTITGVADGQLSADSKEAVNGSQLYALQQKVTNGGWDIIGDNENKSTHIGNDKTVSFKSGKNSTVSVTGTDTGAEVKVDVNTAQISTNDAHQATATGTGLADASEVVNAINSAAWNVQKKDGAVQQVKAGDTVTFAAGDNMVLTQSGTSFTYGLAPDVNTNSIRLGGTQGTNGSWTGGIYIGKQIGGGANLNEGDYITGLDNTAWDLSKVVENRAATEGQLKAAINQVTIASQSGGFGLRDEKGSTVSQMLGQTVGIIGDTEYEADGKTVKQKGNITTEADSTNAGAVKVKLNKDLDLTEQGSVTIGTTSLTSGQAKVGNVTVNGNDNTVSGLANTTWDEATAKRDGYKGSTKAATESQLQAVYDQATTTASANEQHIQAGTYDIVTQSDANGKKQNSVTMNIVDGSGNTKGQVVINDVAKASDLGDTTKLDSDIQNKNGSTSVVDAVNNLNDKVGDNKYLAVTGKEIQNGDSSTTAIGKLNNRMNDIYSKATQHSTVTKADDNVTIQTSTNADGGTNYQIGLNKDEIHLGNVTIQGNEGSITANSMTADTFTAGNTVVSNDGVKVGDKSALTGDSLKVGGKTYVDDKGVDANGQAIRNVGDGKNDGDAVNVKQVNDLAARQGEAIGQNAAHINQLDRAVNRLDSRINRVGAGAAALAALHPGNYDPDDKVDFAAGFGNYRGASAAAVGMYYHPDETTTMSVGASFGGGENMVNAGITWKMGKDSGHMRTQAAQKAVPVQFVAAPTQTQQSSGQAEGTKMPQPVTAVTTTASGQQVPIVAAYLPSVDNSTRAENDELKELLARQTAILEKLADQKTAPAQAAAPVSGEDLFPDVPENHWAYDFVAKLAQAGALKDCRVEDPANNPMLTRNDFAQILYTALKNGATKNPALNKDGGLNHLANEFRAELKNVKR